MATLSVPALAQNFPVRPVRIVLGTAPGGSPDTFARLIARVMSERWGPVIVENRPGASGNLAAEAVARAAPDGYTLYVCDSATWGINPHVYAKLPYDPLRDFAGVTTIAELPTFLTLHPAVPATRYEEFIAYAKERPGQLAYSSAGSGSIHHLTTELFKARAGVDLVHVPYKGMGPGGAALMSGEVQVAFSSYTAVAAAVRAGRLRILATSAARRSSALPAIPSLDELGLRGFDMYSVLGALVPAGTSREIVANLRAAIVAAIAAPEVSARMAEFGVTVRTGTPEEFDALMRAEHAKFAQWVRLAGVRPE